MSWLYLEGALLEVPKRPDRIDKGTGEVHQGRYQAQILVEKTLQNGQPDFQVVKVYTDDVEAFRAHVGKTVRVPVDCYTYRESWEVSFKLPPGALPEPAALNQHEGPQGAGPKQTLGKLA